MVLEINWTAAKNNIGSYRVIRGDVFADKEESTTIQLKKSTVKELKSIKRHPTETYNETTSNIIKLAKEHKSRRQYDEFLHRVQQEKNEGTAE